MLVSVSTDKYEEQSDWKRAPEKKLPKLKNCCAQVQRDRDWFFSEESQFSGTKFLKQSIGYSIFSRLHEEKRTGNIFENFLKWKVNGGSNQNGQNR